MIDIESQIFTAQYNRLNEVFEGQNLTIESLTNLYPTTFPYVSIEMTDNFSFLSTRTNSSNENYAEIVFEVNVFTDGSKKKQDGKKIFNEVDATFNEYGFTRYSFNPILLNNGSILRMFGRYRAVVSKDNIIFKR